MGSVYSNNATVIFREDLTSDLCVIRVKPDSGEVGDFVAGQFAELSFVDDGQTDKKKITRRAYSIASGPDEKSFLEFYLALVPEGKLTPKLWQLKVGDKLWLGPNIKGKFTLEKIPPKSNLICVATGTGLAPFRSMLYQEFISKSLDRKDIGSMSLVHGVRYEQDLTYRFELEDKAATIGEFKYFPICSREPESSPWLGFRGRVGSLFQSVEEIENLFDVSLESERVDILLCGNPQMIEDMQLDLAKFGFAQGKKKILGNLHYERYW